MRGGEAFTLVVSVGGAATDPLVLLLVGVVGPSVGDIVPALMRMLAAAATFKRTSTSLDMQSAALL